MPVAVKDRSQFFPSNFLTVSDLMFPGSMHAAVTAYPSGLDLHEQSLQAQAASARFSCSR